MIKNMYEKTSAKTENNKKTSKKDNATNKHSLNKSKNSSSCGSCRSLSSPRLSSENASSVLSHAKAMGKESCAVSFMQRNYGNRFTASVLSPTIQRKCSCGGSCSRCKGEEEADKVSMSIMKMESPAISHKPYAIRHTPSVISYKSSAINQPDEQGVISDIMASKGSGQRLDNNTGSFMGQRFGHNFSHVRVHNDNYAARKSNELNAEAFTIGRDIFFNAGRYNPSSTGGKQLLAHELTHVVQQSNGCFRLTCSKIDDRRKKIVETALSLTKEHYLMGAGGQIPGIDGSGVNSRKVILNAENHAASIDVDYGKDKGTKTHVCGGRFSKISLPEGDPSNKKHQDESGKYKWKRTSEGDEVWGEACEGKRHFDCGGFVSYCYHQACPEVTYPGPARGLLSDNFGWKEVPKEQIQGGDIAYRDGHAGLCIDNVAVISALGKKWGVDKKEKVDQYTKFGKLKCLIDDEKKSEDIMIQKKQDGESYKYEGERYNHTLSMCGKLKLLFKNTCSTAAINNCSDEDLLTAICIGEAGNINDRDGKKGVMNVVMNRVSDSAFPNTIREVVTAPNQFHGLSMGINRLNQSAFSDCRDLAREVMNNPADDPTYGALWFNQSCQKPCSEYCTTYLGDGSSRAHYFSRRATMDEKKTCEKSKNKVERHCCDHPRTRTSYITFTEEEVEPITIQGQEKQPKQTTSPSLVPCALPVLLGIGRTGCGSGTDFTHFDFPSISLASTAKLAAWAANRPFSRGQSRFLVTNMECEIEMDAVLTILAGGAGHDAFTRFATGTGGTKTHNKSSMLGALALGSPEIKSTVASVKSIIESQLVAQAASGTLNPCVLLVKPPATHFASKKFYYPGALKSIIGGTHGEKLFATGFTGDIPSRSYTIDLRFLICDNFGVDESDLYAPGLFAFWVLQHERSASRYAPFINQLDLPVTVSGTF